MRTALNYDGMVFHGPRSGVVKPDTVRRILVKKVIKPLQCMFPSPPDEIGFADGRVHTFRHYFCSKCAQDGIPEQTVSKWLGHRDSNMIKLYYHLHNDVAQQQMKKIKSVGGLGTV